MTIPFFIVITGQTGVGKTALVDDLVEQIDFPIEVINADMGQLYKPLSIGTAKPDLSQPKVSHHLFDVLDDPEDFTAYDYRQNVMMLMKEISSRGAVPVIVGGSLFYIASLFYPPSEVEVPQNLDTYKDVETAILWQRLYEIDPSRAKKIHKHDRYRIVRALSVWDEVGVQPSTLEPHFDPPGCCALYFVTRDRQELSERISHRVKSMFEIGWMEEVQQLSSSWHTYLLKKKIIGYPDIIQYLDAQERGVLVDDASDFLIEKIGQRTRSYAKRQHTFWKQFIKRIKQSDPDRDYIKKISELNLTLLPYDLYLKQLQRELKNLYRSCNISKK